MQCGRCVFSIPPSWPAIASTCEQTPVALFLTGGPAVRRLLKIPSAEAQLCRRSLLHAAEPATEMIRPFALPGVTGRIEMRILRNA